MPQRKQPAGLQVMALDVLLEHAVQCCIHHSIGRSVERIRECITFLKINVCNCIPRKSLANFCNGFVTKFHKDKSVCKSHSRAVIEILMDLQIETFANAGYQAVSTLCISDAPRFRGLKKLHLPALRDDVNIENFYLRDLRAVFLLSGPTDSDIEKIVRNAPNLEDIIMTSTNLTNKGLCALAKCEELQRIHIELHGNVDISSHVLRELLSTHKKLVRLTFSNEYVGFDVLYHRSPSVLSVYPSITNLDLDFSWGTTKDLRSIAAEFPNLRRLGIGGSISGDIRVLNSLSKLSALDLRVAQFDWGNLKQLLQKIGSQISELVLGTPEHGYVGTQGDLDFIFKFCPNVEFLCFSAGWPDSNDQVLVVPPFKKLKEFECDVRWENAHSESRLVFGQMLNLEKIGSSKFYFSTEMILEIIRDDKKFPMLKRFHAMYVRGPRSLDFDLIKQLVKNNNLLMEVSIRDRALGLSSI